MYIVFCIGNFGFFTRKMVVVRLDRGRVGVVKKRQMKILLKKRDESAKKCYLCAFLGTEN